ncbi:hypothetical protein KY331_05300 [Candidatus Woesearchaeota archaeon]|nr:hypothetical protein [Candidatus Woesearchaeota archaeon]
MKNQVLGIALICILLILGVYAFGPHTRFTAMNEVCVYYYGPGNSCEVEAKHCNPEGGDTYVLLSTDECILPEEAVQQETVAPLPTAAPKVEQPAIVETVSYLYIVIPLLVLFALLTILWMAYAHKYHAVRDALAACLFKKRTIAKDLRIEQSKRIRPKCPRDGAVMKISGQLKQGPKGGMRATYVCPKCGHRAMKTLHQ